MRKLISFYEAREILLTQTEVLEKEEVELKDCAGRILGQDVTARANVPPFDRSPYDGYAFCAEDTRNASKECPITLRILEEIPAGSTSHTSVTRGCAVKILTGAPIPKGADAVTKYEATEFTEETVTLFESFQSGDNIVRSGEDVAVGELLARRGTSVDAGLAGTLAAQNMESVVVYRIPRIGVISTGSELLSIGSPYEPGKTYNSNQYMLCAALRQMGCEPVVLGIAKDCTEEISQLISTGLKECDMVLLTGGVSVGDYDLTPAALVKAGVEILFCGVDLKPGMACCYGRKGRKLVCGLSGNPASAMTNFYAVVRPAIRKLCGCREYLPKEFPVRLLNPFPKKSHGTRLLRGTAEIVDGCLGIRLPKSQGNVVISSAVGCNIMAVVPAGSDPLETGTVLQGFFMS